MESIFAQTASVDYIYILDNGSTDNTKQVLEQMNDPRIVFIGTEQNNGVFYNIQRAQKLANREYVMIFHDDDLLHPNYIEYALRAINEEDNISLVSSGMVRMSNPDIAFWRDYSFSPCYFTNTASFASLLYFGFPINFASVIYKTEYFKTVSVDAGKYGKIADRPFIFDCAKDGKIAILKGQYVQYRVHGGQDSGINTNGPYPNETLALHAKYKELIFAGNFFCRLRYRLNIYFYLKSEFSRFPNSHKLIFAQYKSMAFASGVLERIDIIYWVASYVFGVRFFYKLYRLMMRNIGQMS